MPLDYCPTSGTLSWVAAGAVRKVAASAAPLPSKLAAKPSRSARAGAAAARKRRLVRRTKAPKASERFLRDLRVREPTRRRYEASVDSLASFVGVSASGLLAFDDADLDEVVEHYLEALFDRNADRSAASYVVAALSFFRVCPLKDPYFLVRSRAALAGWKKYEPDSARLPCPWVAALLVMSWLASQKKASMLQSARALALQFDLMARPGEIVQLLVGSVVLPRPGAHGYQKAAVIFAPSDAVLRLDDSEAVRLTKTGEQDDTVAIDSASFPGMRQLLERCVADAARNENSKLFPLIDYSVYLRHLQLGAEAVRLPFHLSPHMVRHGGASEAVHRQSRTLKEVQVRGRWRAFESVRRYQKSGRLLTMVRRLSQDQLRCAGRLELLFPRFLL